MTLEMIRFWQNCFDMFPRCEGGVEVFIQICDTYSDYRDKPTLKTSAPTIHINTLDSSRIKSAKSVY